MAFQPGILRSNFMLYLLNHFLSLFLAPSIFLELQHDFPARHTSDSYHILNDGNDDDIINNADDFVILMLAVVVFEILLAWLVVAMLLVILVLTTALLEKLLVWLVFAMFLLLLPTGLQYFRRYENLALMLVMKLQVMTILLNMVVMFSILAESFFKHGGVTRSF